MNFVVLSLQRLKSNVVTDLTPGIWNQNPSEQILKMLATKKVKTDSTSFRHQRQPGLQTNVIKMKWCPRCFTRYTIECTTCQDETMRTPLRYV
ncbi:hypothetical protein J6590_061370 [Homalodisca vitripennis]|nr:hypothetical protein J6590_061370 [Homalodisca vitripennis]